MKTRLTGNYNVVAAIAAALVLFTTVYFQIAGTPIYIPETMLEDEAYLNIDVLGAMHPHIQVDGHGLEYDNKRQEYCYSGTNVRAVIMPIARINGKSLTIIDWKLLPTEKINSDNNRTIFYHPHDGTWRER